MVNSTSATVEFVFAPEERDLHSFDYHDARAGVDLFANLDQDARHLAGHRRDDMRSLVCVFLRHLRTAQAFRIGEGDRVTRRADHDVDSLSGFGAAFDSTIEDPA